MKKNNNIDEKLEIQTLGNNIDTAISTKNLQDLNRYQNEALGLLNNLQSNNDKGIVHYYIGNVYLFRYDLKSKANDKLQCKKRSNQPFFVSNCLIK